MLLQPEALVKLGRNTAEALLSTRHLNGGFARMRVVWKQHSYLNTFDQSGTIRISRSLPGKRTEYLRLAIILH